MRAMCLFMSVLLIFSPVLSYGEEVSKVNNEASTASETPEQPKKTLADVVFSSEGPVSKFMDILDILMIPLIPLAILSGSPLATFDGVDRAKRLIKGDMPFSTSSSDTQKEEENTPCESCQ